ncbi:MAG: hypothetical protein WCA00_18330 [Candidatus Acidiferrales bacterium]
MRIHKLALFAAAAAAVAIAVLHAGTLANATTLERMSLAKMAQTAPLIVRARCLANSTAWDAGEIWTFTSFAIEDTWKGAPPGAAAQLTVRLLGGSLGNLTSTVSGVPRFHPGEELILFLEPTSRGDFSIVSWVQGTFRIHRDPRTGGEIVLQDTAAFDTFNPATHRFESAGIRNLSVAAFSAQVQSALRATTGEKK